MEASPTQPSYWRKCSACKRPIQFSQKYQVCSVSTCTKKRGGFVFCTVPCWASHVPTFRHRDAWAIEETAPTLQAYLMEMKSESASSDDADPERKKVVMSQSPSNPTVSDSEILVVVSKLKAYIKAKADMNTSGDVMDLLSDRLRSLCDEAIRTARQEGRKTVMARDFNPRSES